MNIEGRSTASGANVIVEHYCCDAECGKWGGFGFSAGKAQETRWWCWEHYPYREPINGPVKSQ